MLPETEAIYFLDQDGYIYLNWKEFTTQPYINLAQNYWHQTFSMYLYTPFLWATAIIKLRTFILVTDVDKLIMIV